MGDKLPRVLSFGCVNLWASEKLDIGSIYSWVNNEDLRRLTAGVQRPRSMPELEAWLTALVNSHEEEVFSIKTPDAEMIGFLNLSRIDRRAGWAEVGLLIDPEFWGRGYGHDALVAAVAYAFEDLRLHRLQAEILSINSPSKRLFEKLGFVSEGVRREAVFLSGRYLDVDLYGLLNRDFHRPEPKTAAPETRDIGESSEGAGP